MTVDSSTIVAIVVPSIGGIAWLFRLQSRVDVIESRYLDMRADLTEIKTDVKKIRSFMGGGVER